MRQRWVAFGRRTRGPRRVPYCCITYADGAVGHRVFARQGLRELRAPIYGAKAECHARLVEWGATWGFRRRERESLETRESQLATATRGRGPQDSSVARPS